LGRGNKLPTFEFRGQLRVRVNARSDPRALLNAPQPRARGLLPRVGPPARGFFLCVRPLGERNHPLRAIAKVAATLIVVGSFALKAARWGWSVV
jgi:hypothetical protein